MLEAPWSNATADAELLDYLRDRGGSLLRVLALQQPLPPSHGGRADAAYVINSFVVSLHERDPEGYRHLDTVVRGAVLAGSLYFPELGAVRRRLERLRVFLDTQLLMHLLGFQGSDAQAPVAELILLLRTLGAAPACFEDTLDEVRGILRFTLKCLTRPEHVRRPLWGVAEFLIAEGRSPSDLELLIGKLADLVRNSGVDVRQRPPHVSALTVDELELERVLRSRVRYPADAPVKHDLDALTAVHRLRGGNPHQLIETSRAIFVTLNTSLAYASTAFFRRHYRVRTMAPLCLPDHQLATLAWLKQPAAAPDLPMRMVVADCYAGLNPPREVWERYVREINRLEENGSIETEDYYLLRHSSSAKRAVMGITLGGALPFVDGSVPEILERARKAQRADLERQLESESAARESDAPRGASDLAATQRELTTARSVVETERRERKRWVGPAGRGHPKRSALPMRLACPGPARTSGRVESGPP